MESPSAPFPPVPPNSPIPSAEPPIISPQPHKEKSPQGIFIILALILIAGAFFAYKYYQLKKTTIEPQASSTPTSIISPEPIVEAEDPTADWLTYENQTQNYSFKYPSDWEINQSGASVDINNKLTLAKDNYIITLYSNIQGVNATVKQVPSTPIVIDGLNLFKRDIGDNFYSNTGSFEISASDSSPTFKYQDKTYEIYITYPLGEKGTENHQTNLNTFDLILSTLNLNSIIESLSPVATPSADLQVPVQ